jgi:hypothetical protein
MISLARLFTFRLLPKQRYRETGKKLNFADPQLRGSAKAAHVVSLCRLRRRRDY